MKLRSLFLATLAAMAMVSCSNENDPIENGGNVEKNASLMFSIGVPANTRAATANGTEDGISEEQGFSTVEVKLAYSSGSTSYYSFTYDDFDHASTVHTLKADKKMEVGADAAATIYVTLNGGKAVNESATETAAYDTYGSISTGIAAPNKFLMSGKKTVTIVANKDNNEALVTVNRVAAKIAEQSDATKNDGSFTFNTEYRKNGETISTETEEMTATIQDYTLINLNKVTNVFYNATYPAADFFQPVVLNNQNDEEYSSLVNRAIGDGNGTTPASFTYCTENNSETNATSIVYRVKYTYKDNSTTGTFFTKKKGDKWVLYKDFETMDKDSNGTLSGAGLDGTESYDELIAAGVRKYENGEAYYTNKIETAGAGATIARNNVYKLKVKSISSLGNAVIDEKIPGEPTYLLLEVTMAPWTINLNNFEL